MTERIAAGEGLLMEFDTLTLSRIQFAFTVMFHYLFPPLSIVLGVVLVIMEGLYLRTGNVLYQAMTRFWVRIFAINFAAGVATGITMEFQYDGFRLDRPRRGRGASEPTA